MAGNAEKRVFSGVEFDRKAGLLPQERRTLVRAGILEPARTGCGWPIFSPDDVEKAKQWKAERRGR